MSLYDEFRLLGGAVMAKLCERTGGIYYERKYEHRSWHYHGQSGSDRQICGFQKNVCLYILSEVRTRWARLIRHTSSETMTRKKRICKFRSVFLSLFLRFKKKHNTASLFFFLTTAKKPISDKQKQNNQNNSPNNVWKHHHYKHSDRHPK